MRSLGPIGIFCAGLWHKRHLPFQAFASVFDLSARVSSVPIFFSLFQSFDLFTCAKRFVVASMASMATPPDSGDSNLPKEPGNEVCDIINCVAKIVPSTGFKEAEVDSKLWKILWCVYFLNLIHSWLSRPSKSFYCDAHVFTVCIWWIWSDLEWMPSTICCDCLWAWWATWSGLANRS